MSFALRDPTYATAAGENEPEWDITGWQGFPAGLGRFPPYPAQPQALSDAGPLQLGLAESGYFWDDPVLQDLEIATGLGHGWPGGSMSMSAPSEISPMFYASPRVDGNPPSTSETYFSNV